MELAYKPAMWHDLFVMIGTTAGTLVGLLFIVMSLHLDKIRERTDNNIRATIDGARYNTIHLLTVFCEAAVVLSPQSLTYIGAELIALNILGLRLPLIFARTYFNSQITISHSGGFPTGLILTIITTYLVGIVAGVIVFRQIDWGLFLVAASCVVKIVRAALTAWMLMFGVLRAK